MCWFGAVDNLSAM